MGALALKSAAFVGSPDLVRARREVVRWQCLVAMDGARPGWLGEATLLAALTAAQPGMTQPELRRELDYLEVRGLARTERNRQWACRLTREGMDLVEYTTHCEPGIARPALD